MKKLVQAHKRMMNSLANRFDLSAYQCIWLAFIKGLLIGWIVGTYL
jgi:hypothetical protein